jgi:hypothetical protein
MRKHTLLIFSFLIFNAVQAQVRVKDAPPQFVIRDKSIQLQFFGYQSAALYYDFLIYKFSDNLRLFSRVGAGFSKDYFDYTYDASAHIGLSYQTDVLTHVFFDVSNVAAYGETVDSKSGQVFDTKIVRIGVEGAIRFYIDPKRYYRIGVVPFYNFDVRGKDFSRNEADVGAFFAFGRAF